MKLWTGLFSLEKVEMDGVNSALGCIVSVQFVLIGVFSLEKMVG